MAYILALDDAQINILIVTKGHFKSVQVNSIQNIFAM